MVVKQILCSLKEPNEFLLKSIYESGLRHGWNIECCSPRDFSGWSGDGVLTDYLSEKNLRKIRDFDRTMIVSRWLTPGRNIRSIFPDVLSIANQVVDYFQAKGFSRFSTVFPSYEQRYVCGRPVHIIHALEQVLAARNLPLNRCFLSCRGMDYRKRETLLLKFFKERSLPIALFLPGVQLLPICYRVLSRLKLRVPEEVAILTNTDHWTVTENAMVPTSYIGGEFAELGLKMTELLHRMLNGAMPPPEPIFVSSAGIVSRRSTDILAVSDRRLAGAVTFLFQNYMKFISVDDAAQVVGLSRGMLTRLFQSEFRKSPRQFLQEIRFNQIRNLLDGTDLTLSEIAHACGYGSDMALSLAFRREMSMTPGEYRKKRRHLSSAEEDKGTWGSHKSYSISPDGGTGKRPIPFPHDPEKDS